MKKIAKTLEKSIRQHPEESYRVLIVTKEKTDLKKLKIGDVNQIMDNIISAELKGAKILSIAEHPSVKSIELDGEMNIT